MSALPFLRTSKETRAEAARLYRKSRARRRTVPAADALIAATAVAYGVQLLTADHSDFGALARVSKLRVIELR